MVAFLFRQRLGGCGALGDFPPRGAAGIEIDVIVVVHCGPQTLAHSLAGFADAGRENPFLATHQQVCPRQSRRQIWTHFNLIQTLLTDLSLEDTGRLN
jgi:hypothetical protein